MDYFQVGLFSLQGIILIWYLKKDRSKSLQDHINQNRKINSFFEDYAIEFQDKIENIKYEIHQMQKDLHSLHQQQISWINSNKVLPPVGERVLMLNGSTNTEEEGFLTSSQNFWEVFKIGGQGMRVSLKDVSQWKPLLNKKTAPK